MNQTVLHNKKILPTAMDNKTMHIKIDNLQGPEIYALLQEHVRTLSLLSPPESMHALDIQALRSPDITFWTAWSDHTGNAQLLGCGALKQLDAEHAELKSMRTDAAHLQKGVAQALLTHILKAAKQRSIKRLSLETGPMEAFAAARNLYAKNGFTYCGPFAEYVPDPYSVFMTKVL
jgi:putative acetyltransferase